MVMTRIIISLLFVSLAYSETPKPYLNELPGVAPVDVYLNCEKAGFTVEKNLSGPDLAWMCLLKEGKNIALVSAHSNKASTVRTISAVVGPANEVTIAKGGYASILLGWVSSSAYTGQPEKQAKLRDWVENNLATGGTAYSEGVYFNVWTEGESAHLRISVTPKQ
jgi:hypothetical protein